MSTRRNYGQRINLGREKKIDLVLFVLCLVIMIIGFLYVDSGITGYAVFRTTNDTFDDGDFNRTFWNKTGFVQLNYTQGFFKGNYSSSVIDAGSLVSWSNISWCEGSGCLNLYGEELPANQKGRTITDKRINMTGNILYYRFNNQSEFGESQTLVYDFSGNNSNGTFTYVNGTSNFTFTNKILGTGALDLDGDADYVNLTDIDFSGNVSFSAWIYPNSASNSFVFARGLGCAGNTRVRTPFSIRYMSEWGGVGYVKQSIRFAVMSTGTCSGGAEYKQWNPDNFTVPQNEWTFITVTVQDNHKTTRGVSIYINGVNQTKLYNEDAGTPDFQQFSNYSTTIGSIKMKDVAGYEEFFKGRIDELAIWNRTLSPNEVKQLYLAGATNLSVQVRSCDDAGCSGETFVGPDNTANTYFTNASLVELNTTVTLNNRWLQYRSLFETNSFVNSTLNGTTSELYNVTIHNNASDISNLILNTTDVTKNGTNQNLTLSYDVSQGVSNITNWYRNGTSIMVLNMPFEKINSTNTGNAWDYSGYENNGTEEGATWNSTAGVDGKGAYTFDGVNDRINFTDSGDFDFDIDTPFSVAFWFKTNGSVSNQAFITKTTNIHGRGWYIWTWTGSNTLIFDLGNGSSQNEIGSSQVITDGIMRHAVATYDGNSNSNGMRLYLNGVLVSTGGSGALTEGVNNFNNSKKVIIGTLGDLGNDFNGTIDNVQIYNRSLSAEQIKELYNNRTFIIVQNETVSDEVWYACVTPNNGDTDGNKACSNNVTITANYNPVINSNITSPTTPVVSSSVQLIANVSDADGTPSDILEVNFTLVAPNRTAVINNVNGTLQGGATADNWSSTSYITQDVGIWKWYVNASDGSATDTDFGIFTINDTTNPSITLTNPTNATTTLSTSVTFNATLTEDINLINTSIYGTWAGGWHKNQSSSLVGTSNNSNFTVANLIGGTYLWNIQACDNSSNCDFATSNFTITINTAPVINLNVTSPTTPSKTKTIQIIANVSDADGTPSNLISVNFTLKAPNGTKVIDHVNGTLQGGANADNWSSTSYTILDNGTWTWTVNVTDIYGATDNDIGTFIISNAAPVINSNVTSPTTNLNLSNLQIIANVSDADGNSEIREVNFTLIAPNGTKVINNINGTLVGASDNWSSSSYTIFDNGTWTWTVNLTDKYYDADTDIGYFTITDNTVPSITSESRKPETVTTATSVTLNATVTEDLRLDTIIITEDSSGTWKNYSITNPVSNVYSFSLHSNNFSQSQTIQYRWYANDSSNNLAASALTSFVVQSTQTQNTPSGSPSGPSTTTSPGTAQVAQINEEITTTDTDLSDIPIETLTDETEISQEQPIATEQISLNPDLKGQKISLQIVTTKLNVAIKNYRNNINNEFKLQINTLKQNTNLLMNTRITKAQLQVKEVVTYAVLPTLVIILLLVLVFYGVYRLTSIKYKFLNVVQMYNLLIKMNRIEEAKILLLDIGEFNYRLSLKSNYPNLINEIKMKYPNIDETIKEAVIQKLNEGAEKFQDQIRNYMIKK